MLGEIIKALRETGAPLDVKELSKLLGTDESALEGMLLTLVHQGKLREVTPGTHDCAGCSRFSSCDKARSHGPMPRSYELVT